MRVYVVEIDRKDNDTWELFGVFSTEEIANKKLKEANIHPSCSSTTPVYVDELV